MKKYSKVILMLLAVLVISVGMMSTKVLATAEGGENNVVIIGPSNNASTNTQNTTNTTNNATGATNTNSNKNSSTYNTTNNSKLPQTGLQDQAVGIIIAVCAVSAVFAYKKIRDYKM